MNIQRLKFAHARGARIEYRFDTRDQWNPASDPGYYPRCEYRIHPDDAHLEYGPVSSVLRQDRTNRSLFASGAALIMVSHLAFDECQFVVENKSNEDLITLVRLFYAEFLADEGL